MPRTKTPKEQPPTSAQSRNLASKSKKAEKHTKPKQDGGNLPDETATPKSTNVASSSVPGKVRQESVTEDEANDVSVICPSAASSLISIASDSDKGGVRDDQLLPENSRTNGDSVFAKGNGARKKVGEKEMIKGGGKARVLPEKQLSQNYGSQDTGVERASRSSTPTVDNSTPTTQYRDRVGKNEEVPENYPELLALAQRLQNQEYKIWVKAGLCFLNFKTALEILIKKYSKGLHQKVLRELSYMCCDNAYIDYKSGNIVCELHKDKTLSLNILQGFCKDCSFEYDEYEMLYVQRCSCHKCDAILKTIRKNFADNFVLKQENLKNSDLQAILREHWQMAKLLMNAGQKIIVNTAVDTDLSGQISFMNNYKFARESLVSQKTERTLNKVRDFRNAVFHSPNMKISDDDFKDNVKCMLRFLERYPREGMSDAKLEFVKNIKRQICLIKKVEFKITLGHETKVRDELENERERKNEGKATKVEVDELRRILNNQAFDIEMLKNLLEQKRTSTFDAESCQMCKQSLIDEYERRYRELNLSPIYSGANEDVKKVSFEELYSDIDIRDKNGVIVESYSSDVFLDSVGRNKNIVIKGVNGIGKSTFCKHLVKIWCQANRNSEITDHKQAALSRFQYLFLVQLDQDKGDKTCILDYLHSSLERLSDKKNIINYIIEEQSEAVLFIIDGYGENSHILTDKKLNKCTVVWTIDTAYYDSICSGESFKIDTVLTLNGLNDTGIENLIQKTIKYIPPSKELGDRETIAKKCSDKLKSFDLFKGLNSPFILKTLVNAWIEKLLRKSFTCNILEMLRCFSLKADVKQKSDTEHNDKPIEQCVTEVLNCTLSENLSPQHVRRNKNLKILSTKADILLKIGKLAYKGITDSAKCLSLSCTEKNFDIQMKDDFQRCFNALGIMTKTTLIPMLDKKEISFSFLHHHFQDFFCALWIISQKCQDSDWLSHKNHVHERENVIRFICGLNASFGSKLCRYIVRLITEDLALKTFRLRRTFMERDRVGRMGECQTSFRNPGVKDKMMSIEQCLEALTDLLLLCMTEATFGGASNLDLVIADVVQSKKPVTGQLLELITQSIEHLQTIFLYECQEISYDNFFKLTKIIGKAGRLQAVTLQIKSLEETEEVLKFEIDLSSLLELRTLDIGLNVPIDCHLQFGKGCTLESFRCMGIRMSEEQWIKVFENLSEAIKLALIQLTDVNAKAFFLKTQKAEIDLDQLNLKKIHLEKMEIEEKIQFSKEIKFNTLVLKDIKMNEIVGNALFQLPQMEWLCFLELSDLAISEVDINLKNCKRLAMLLMSKVHARSVIISEADKLEEIQLQTVTTADSSSLSQCLKCFPTGLKKLALEDLDSDIEADLNEIGLEYVLLNRVTMNEDSFIKLCKRNNVNHALYKTKPVQTNSVRIESEVRLKVQKK